MKQPTTKTNVSRKQKSNVVLINKDDRQAMISEAAYYLAEKRGFNFSDPLQDWFEAEKSIELQINVNV